jgi:hypothetical protein
MAKAKTKKQPVKAKPAKTKKSPKRLAKFRPMNVVVAPGSTAEKYYQAMALPLAALIKPQVIAPGFPPTPEHNLINHGGKTIQDLMYTNFFIGGWPPTIITAIYHMLKDRTLYHNLGADHFQRRSKDQQRIDCGTPGAVILSERR